MATRQLEDVLKEVRRIQIVARRQVNDLLAGEYLSVFKGRGMEFDAVREYVPGDEIRSIDWNVTARTGTPFVKTFCEERELTVILAVDISASGSFGSFRLSKMETAVEVAAVLMFTALRNHDKVGLLFFTDDVVKYIPPRKGRANVLRLIRELLATEPVKAPTDISKALDFLGRVQRRRCVVFVMSDFLGPDCSHALAIANQRHDCVAVTMEDPRESSLPDVGFLTLRDAETDELLELDTRHPRCAPCLRKRLRNEKAAGGLAPPGERRSPRDSHGSALRVKPAEVLSDARAATMTVDGRTWPAPVFPVGGGGEWHSSARWASWWLVAAACEQTRANPRRLRGTSIERSAEKGPVKLSVTVSPREPRLSDLVDMQVRVAFPPGVEIKPPAFGQAVGDFLVRDYSERPAETTGGGIVPVPLSIGAGARR